MPEPQEAVADLEMVIYDALIDGEGYYPGQLAERITAAVRAKFTVLPRAGGVPHA